MEANFLSQNPCILSWPGVFQFGIFFSISLSSSMFISPFGPSSHSSFLVILFINSTFSLCFLVALFSSKNVRFLRRPVVGMFLCHVLSVVGRIFFRCFGMSCFVYIVLPFVDISLISLLLPKLSGLFPQVMLFFSRVVFSILFPHIPGSFCLTILASFRRFFFLSSFPVEFLNLVLTVSSCLLRGSQFSHILISPLHRLVRLTLLYYSLTCKVVYDLSCSFLF